MNKYVGFKDVEDIKNGFESTCDDLKDSEVIFASYGGGSYEGDAIVLFEREGKLYTSEGGHCSCYGLEGQWEAIETCKEALKIREFDKDYHEEFIEFLKDFLGDKE